MYKFSAPMPYSKQDIDKILNINNQVQKSKITNLYACVPRGCEVFTGFEQSRNFAFSDTSWDYWKSLIEYTLSQGCDFIYLLNSPRPFNIKDVNFVKQLEKLELLLLELKKLGINKLRIASVQLMSYLGKHYKDFIIYASTSLDYKTIWEYQNFIFLHPEIKQIIPSHDINKNFKLLSALIKKYPNMEFELMVNEGCLQGCPHRTFHELVNIDNEFIINNDLSLSNAYGTNLCNKLVDRYPIQNLVIGNHIYPWEIEEYAKLGFKKFKLVGRDGFTFNIKGYINSYLMYLKGIDDLKLIQDFEFANYFHHFRANPLLQDITVKNYKKFLPKISYFKKYGHLCSSRCTVECKYCYKCAEKLQKEHKKRQKEKEKLSNFTPTCFIN